jgi:hypothetical protein
MKESNVIVLRGIKSTDEIRFECLGLLRMVSSSYYASEEVITSPNNFYGSRLTPSLVQSVGRYDRMRRYTSGDPFAESISRPRLQC